MLFKILITLQNSILKDLIHLFKRAEGREKERERNINV